MTRPIKLKKINVSYEYFRPDDPLLSNPYATEKDCIIGIVEEKHAFYDTLNMHDFIDDYDMLIMLGEWAKEKKRDADSKVQQEGQS